MWEEFHQARQHTLSHEDLAEHFRETVLGGAWNIERRGRALFGVRADVVPGTVVAQFMRRFGLTMSASFEDQLYGERDGHLLCVVWQKRMVALYKHWCAHGQPEVFPAGMEVGVLADAEQGLAERLKGRALKRLQAILRTVPS